MILLIIINLSQMDSTNMNRNGAIPGQSDYGRVTSDGDVLLLTISSCWKQISAMQTLGCSQINE